MAEKGPLKFIVSWLTAALLFESARAQQVITNCTEADVVAAIQKGRAVNGAVIVQLSDPSFAAQWLEESSDWVHWDSIPLVDHAEQMIAPHRAARFFRLR